ncbi:MAG: TIGR02147 family protein [Polyangiaceae bacterium]|nr:TIGR02147 family protein [Polyangiaceae bacterium]
MASSPSVYEYLDYRSFMRDVYAARKAADAKFSFRFFARRAGFSSSNFLKLVMDGDRNLGPTAIDRVASAMKLTADEAEFFALLVAMNQAQTVADRNRAFERVAANRRFRAARKLDGPLFEYLTRWYYPVIRELAGRDDFVEDAAWVASQVYPPIEAREAKSALKTLEKLGLLVRDEAGKLARGEASLTTGHEVRHVVVPAYHLQMIERAAKAVEIVPVDQRDVSSLTVCIRESTLTELKAKIHRFREEMLDRCDTDTDPERVYQLCIQLFPLSKSKEVAQKPAPRAAPPTRRRSLPPPRNAGE